MQPKCGGNVAEAMKKVLKPLKNQEVEEKMKLGIVVFYRFH